MLTLALWARRLFQRNKPYAADAKWFRLQHEGLNPLAALTECGPTLASNVLCWQTGICKGRQFARNTVPISTRAWWWMADISTFIARHGGTVRALAFSHQSVRASLLKGLVVLHVDGNHFIVLDSSGTKLVVYDTNSGKSYPSLAEVLKRVSYSRYLLVPKL